MGEVGETAATSTRRGGKGSSRERLGNYTVMEELGGGGMAIIYKGQHAFLDRIVAIKELKARFRRDSEVQDRFQREAKVAASLSHRNIVQVYDFWREGEHNYLVMELVDGSDAAAILRRVGRLPPHLALALVGQVCGGLTFAHARGIIHRDLKPSNILITKEGVPKIADFGVAHLIADPGLTQPGQTLGTPAYMSPEQIKGERLTPASDVFSLGIVLYELLTGRRPFMEDETESVTAKILNEQPAPPRQVKPGIPRSVERIVLKCLRKRPEQRFRSPTALERAIARVLGGGPTEWERLLREYLGLLPAAGEAPPKLGHHLRIPGHSARRLRRLALTASLIGALAWAGLVLTGARLMGFLPSTGPAWNQPKPSGSAQGQRPPRTQGPRPAGRGAAPQHRP